MIPVPRDPKNLSPRAHAVLQRMLECRDDPDEDDGDCIACCGLECWRGLDRTNWAVVNQLLECCFIRDVSDSSMRRFVINDSGARFLRGELPYRDSEGKYHATLFTMLRT